MGSHLGTHGFHGAQAQLNIHESNILQHISHMPTINRKLMATDFSGRGPDLMEPLPGRHFIQSKHLIPSLWQTAQLGAIRLTIKLLTN